MNGVSTYIPSSNAHMRLVTVLPIMVLSGGRNALFRFAYRTCTYKYMLMWFGVQCNSAFLVLLLLKDGLPCTPPWYMKHRQSCTSKEDRVTK